MSWAEWSAPRLALLESWVETGFSDVWPSPFGGHMIPSAVGKNVTCSADNADLTTAGWKDRDIKS